MQPKVSILVPIYNVEAYLSICMDSIVSQTLKDIEIICVNDGSTDGSLDILKSYADKDDRIVVIDKKNGGYGMAMNIAADKATGEYIGIVEPDDFVNENMFEDLYAKAHKYELDFIKSDYMNFSKNSKTGENVFTLRKLTDCPEKYNVIFDPSQTLDAFKFTMSTWTGIYKRSFILENRIRHNETPGASFQDNGFWFQTFCFAKRAMIVDTPYYNYRKDNPNSSVKNPEKVYALNVEYDYIKKILLRDREQWEKFRNIYWYFRYRNYLFTLSRIRSDFKKAYIERASDELCFGYKKAEFDDSPFELIDRLNLHMIMKIPKLYYLLDRIGYAKVIRHLKGTGLYKKIERKS